MIEVQATIDLDLIKKIMLEDPKLFYACSSDDELVDYGLSQWNPNSNQNYLVLRQEGEIIGYGHWNYITNITADGHARLCSKYWGSGLSQEAYKAAEDWFKEHTQVYKFVLKIPQSQEHALKAAAAAGYEVEGVLMGAIVWRNKVENLILMSKFIRRDK